MTDCRQHSAGKGVCLELRVHDITGRRLQLTSHDVWRLLKLWPSLLFIAIASTTYVAFDGHGFARFDIALWHRALIWFTAIPGHTLLYIFMVLLWGRGQQRWGWCEIYMPVLGLAALVVNVQLITLHLHLYLDTPHDPFLLSGDLLYGWFMASLFELLFFAFTYPVLLDVDAKHTGKTRQAGRNLIAAGESFALGDILYMRGQEHYVQIITRDQAHRVRARLCDLVAQTEPLDGIQAHRSHWVARHAISGIQSENGTDLLILTNGDRLPIARPRRSEVRRWVSEHVPNQTLSMPLTRGTELVR